MLTTAHRSELAQSRTRAPLERSCGFESPLGPLTLVERDGALVSVDFAASETRDPSQLLLQAQIELGEYFAGRRQRFTVKLRPAGSDFQLRAWDALAAIPYGEVVTYGAIARRTGSGPRAIGQACRTNPLLIFIPCHRVVATDGLGGFGGQERALDRKRALLAIEGRA